MSDAGAGAVAQFTPAERERIVTLRRALHAAPELSWHCLLYTSDAADE